MYTIAKNIFYERKSENVVKSTIFDTNEPRLDLLVIDDFYKDPIAIRNFALSQEFNIPGNFPGMRTISFTNNDIRNALQEIMNPFGEILDIHSHTNDICHYRSINNCSCYNSAFFMNTPQSAMPWIHFDNYDYTAIIYLTPDAPLSSGTSTFKLNNGYHDDIEHEYDKTKWSQIDNVGNVFNRILIFNALTYHCPNHYFGLDNNDARLTQVVWFNLKPKTNNDVKNKIIYNETISQSPFILNMNYKCSILIMDNFYKNPEEVRNFALLQKFDITGNFPGFRTKSYLTPEVKKTIEYLLIPYSNYPNINEYMDYHYNGCFQYNTARDRSWIHKDNYNNCAGIIYLTPDAPLSSGTNFYKFYKENIDTDITDKYSQDVTKWNQCDSIGNKFNRLILFNSNQFHISNDYFGSEMNNGRLIQLFFI